MLRLTSPSPAIVPALLLFACAGGGSSPEAPAPPSGIVAVADTDGVAARSARTMGSDSAPVTIYEMSDFQCPFCRRHALETLPLLEAEYVRTGKVRYVFINYPITELHPNAVPTAEIALCAARQGKFWELHHRLFEEQATWARLEDPAARLLELAAETGMDQAKTLECLKDPDIRAAVAFEAQGSARAGATATPSFYIEGGLLVGAQPITIFRSILDSIVKVKSDR